MRLGLSLLFITVVFLSHAQNTQFSGSIVDSLSQEPIPYATVTAVSLTTDKTLSGTTSNDQGKFLLRTDSTEVKIRISFMGYEPVELTSFQRQGTQVALGQISILSMAQDVGTVNVSAEKSTMEFKLDKRVFNIGKDISSTGMGALEALNNVPSVDVDIEGVVRLRGNQGVQILIDGKPSAVSDDPAKALGSITADMIESIEIITNPSAKYDASGTSGIINIILKKDEKKGLNGSISLNTGWPHNHSLGGSINYRRNKFNLFTQFGAGYRSLPRYERSVNENLVNGTTVRSLGVNYRNENFYNITLGTDYYINDYNTLTLSGNFAYEIEQQPSETRIVSYDSAENITSSYFRTESTSALNPKYQYDLQYKKQFKNNEDHVLLVNTTGRFFGKDQSSQFFNNYTLGNSTFPDQRTQTSFYQQDQTYRLDYSNPIRKRWTLESGALMEINDVGNDYSVFNEQNGIYQPDSSLTNDFRYYQEVLGVYVTGAYEVDKWGVKAGLRGENTVLNTLLATTDESNRQAYFNLFPSLHASYKFSKKVQFQAGYSKRIFRPRLWDLNPFFNIRNNFVIRTGNPNLLPEFGDSYEVTSIFILKNITLNSSIYYLYQTNVKENITIQQGNTILTRPENIGTNQKTGLEINWKYSGIKWLGLSGDVNAGVFRRAGSFNDQNFDFSSEQWSTKLTSKFKLKKDWDLEVVGNYQSGYATVQGKVSQFAFANVGVRKKIWKGKAVMNLAVRDVFASRIQETIQDQMNYSFYSFSQRGRFITLGFSYSFGKGEAMSYTGRR